MLAWAFLMLAVLARLPAEWLAHAPRALADPGLVTWVGACLLAPLVETYLLACLIALWRGLRLPGRWPALAAGCSLAGGHALMAGPLWSVTTSVPLVAFALLFDRWQAASFRMAFAAAAAVHGALNGVALALSVLGTD